MSENPNTDERLVDWLYGELDDEAAARFEAELEDDPDKKAEALALRRTRETVAQLPDEDPPPALASILLHEAAKEVAAPGGGQSESKGFFAGIFASFQSLASRPALAAAATLTVVVGVAGALYVGGGLRPAADQVSAPSIAEEAPAMKSAAPDEVALGGDAERAEGAAAGSKLDLPTTVSMNEPEPEPVLPADKSKLKKEAREAAVAPEEQQKKLQLAYKDKEPERRRKSAKKTRKSKNKKKPVADGFAVNANRSKGKVPSQTNVVSSADSKAPGGLLGGVAADRGMWGGAKDNVAAVPQAAGRSVASRRQELDDKWAEQRLVELKRSYKKKDCSRTARIANDILDRNPSFYSKRVRGASAVKKCQWYVQKETKRRGVLRAKRGTAGQPAGKAAPAKAAPRRKQRSYDEAAAESVD